MGALWVVDGNNVYGSRPDGWWRDRRGAARRLVGRIDAWQADHGGDVLVVFDGAADEQVAARHREGLEIAFEPGPGPDAADGRIVREVHERYDAHPELTVVTSDRGLIARLPPGVRTEGAARFLDRLPEG